MVGAGRFELPAPCAQGSFRPAVEMPYFQLLTFQVDGATLLQLVESCGTRRLSPATFLSTAGFSSMPGAPGLPAVIPAFALLIRAPVAARFTVKCAPDRLLARDRYRPRVEINVLNAYGWPVFR
jgi:hypothetical protein